jgi:hypothetical protein
MLLAMNPAEALDMPEPERPAPSILIVVPRERPDLDRSLRRSFAEDRGVHLIADRRQRATGGLPTGEPAAGGDRRRRVERDATLHAGRWIVVPLASRRLDLSDPDVRAILFLCCGDHVVACETCQDTYRFRWLRRDEQGGCTCPRCGSDLAAAVGAHAATCAYWTGRGRDAAAPVSMSLDRAAG